MKRGGKAAALIALLLAAVLLLAGCGKNTADQSRTTEPEATATPVATQAAEAAPAEKTGPIIEPQAIADYLFEHGKLPDNFLTKEEAQALGWDSRYNYVSDVAPGMSLGGDYFGNYQGQLPKVKGRKYFEADCYYTEGKRNECRIIYSNDGHVWYTDDHYNTFTELSLSKP